MITLPTYTLKNTKSNETYDVICSWNELQEKLKEPNVEKILSAPQFISGVSGGQGKRVPDGFKDLKRRIKDNSGRGNTVKID